MKSAQTMPPALQAHVPKRIEHLLARGPPATICLTRRGVSGFRLQSELD
jgi:hypothetical protein